MTGQDTWPKVEVTSVDELRAWLAEHHNTLERAWLITWKKGDPNRHVSYEQLVRQLLCFGWIDSTARRVDDERSGLLIARRRPKSGWSRPNKLRVAELIEAGLMQPAGQAAIDHRRTRRRQHPRPPAVTRVSAEIRPIPHRHLSCRASVDPATLSGRSSEPTRFFRRRAREEDRVNRAICARHDTKEPLLG
jgi:uncharacterized protein YdeI (YjbR/CyaY-like superfamily)